MGEDFNICFKLTLEEEDTREDTEGLEGVCIGAIVPLMKALRTLCAVSSSKPSSA